MIFYFSGTGNSYYVARKIAEKLGERLVSIAAEMSCPKEEYIFEIDPNETIGFVFPIYAWLPPKMVVEFIERLKFSDTQDRYVFAVAVCGDEVGNAMDMLRKKLGMVGLELDSAFSVVMPNNYVVHFDVDSMELARKKLENGEKTIEKIAKAVAERKAGIFQVHRGSHAGLKTVLIGSLFNTFATTTESFYADDKCTGCGICEKVCNCGTITVDGKPRWAGACSQCLACLHYCPVKAIQYGKGTKNKGRYVNPNVDLKEMLKR